MYNKGFFIETPVGNNEFSFDKRKNKKIFVPALIEVKNFDEIKLQDDAEKIAFEDFDFEDKLSTNYGLKNFYRFKFGKKELVLFDNHNHAFYFWYEARKKGIIGDGNILIHIDEHADTRDNGKFISREDSEDLQKVFDFTNFVLNVGDYIIPAEKEGIIGKTIQIRNTKNLEDYLASSPLTSFPHSLAPSPLEEKGNIPHPSPLIQEMEEKNFEGQNENVGNEYFRSLQMENKPGIILNLDLDFFQPDLDFIDFDLKKKVVLDAFDKADFVTVCTSPFFINQKLALEIFKKIFSERL